MPTDGIPRLLEDHVVNITRLATRGKPYRIQSLLDEVEKDYARSMNKLIFDEHLKDPAQQELVDSLDLPNNETHETP